MADNLRKPSRTLDLLSALAPTARRLELSLAKARVCLAGFSLLAVALDPTEPARYARLVTGLLLAFLVYSLAILERARRPGTLAGRAPLVIHAVDVSCATVISSLTMGSGGFFVLYFIFALTAAALRWGSRATVLTALVAVGALIGQALLFASGFEAGGQPPNRFFIRVVSLIVAGYLLGLMAEAARRPEREASALVRMLSRARAELGLRRVLAGILEELLEACRAQRALLVLSEVETGRLWAWQGQRGGDGQPAASSEVAVAGEHAAAYLFDWGAGPWSAARLRRRRGGELVELSLLDAAGRPRDAAPVRVPEGLAGLLAFEEALAVNLGIAGEWTGRLFLVDPDPRGGESLLRFVQRAVRETAPAVENVFLLRRMRTRAGALERARVARELHDGTIQALTGIEMLLEAVRRKAQDEAPEIGTSLKLIQAHLHDEVLAVRELMEQMRRVEVTSSELVGHLAQMIERFARDTGLRAQFVSDLREVELSRAVCGEVARIVQEALVNVRRHAAASNVVVRLAREGDGCLLVIDDDGRGFGFSGRLSHAELDGGRKGPVVIKERVRAARGEIAIDSRPGQGSRIEIRFPWGLDVR